MKKLILTTAFISSFVLSGSLVAQPKLPSDKQVASVEQLQVDKKLNLNNVSMQQLSQVPGIGKSKASAILAFIKKNGALTDFEQLKSIKGVGKQTINKLKENFVIK
ncbi:ComEA family DNA-binding protein [Catenovulum sediminis]|uniref:Helix-hairpin-helix domain-containing protein n=1 Tax=Catenovulum sediminis TaxID=1740262 RepID=A0ABV1RHC4_9ALTE|nr:helix-hairpin-helix domain-containing protein [Catenovulum sediminis]